MFGESLSGYNIGRIGSYGNYVWVVPVLAVITIIMSLQKMPNRVIGAVTGIVPLAAILYAIFRIQEAAGTRAAEEILGMSMHLLSVGAYLTIACSIGLIITTMFYHPRVSLPASIDKITQLERLAKLRESGMLSDAEFEAQKKHLLE